jgi:hypothetical protein
MKNLTLVSRTTKMVTRARPQGQVPSLKVRLP